MFPTQNENERIQAPLHFHVLRRNSDTFSIRFPTSVCRLFKFPRLASRVTQSPNLETYHVISLVPHPQTSTTSTGAHGDQHGHDVGVHGTFQSGEKMLRVRRGAAALEPAVKFVCPSASCIVIPQWYLPLEPLAFFSRHTRSTFSRSLSASFPFIPIEAPQLLIPLIVFYFDSINQT